MAKLHASYLFPEINKRKKALLLKVQSAKIISLGIGDTTLPLTPFISAALQNLRRETIRLLTRISI